jgi:hypothetical protein
VLLACDALQLQASQEERARLAQQAVNLADTMAAKADAAAAGKLQVRVRRG